MGKRFTVQISGADQKTVKELFKALDFLLSERLCFIFRNPFSLMCYNLKIRVVEQKEGGVERPAASDRSLGSFSPLCAVLFGAYMPGHALTRTVRFVFLTPWVPCSSKCLSTSECCQNERPNSWYKHHKNPQLIHTTPAHQLMLCEVKSFVSLNKHPLLRGLNFWPKCRSITPSPEETSITCCPLISKSTNIFV